MNKENRSSQLWSILASAVKSVHREQRRLDICDCVDADYIWLDPIVMRLFKVRLLEQTAKASDENILWLELSPCPVITTFDNLTDLPTVVSSLHLHLYKTFSDSKSTNSTHTNPLLDILTGFDNTGNVQLWPSEIFLAHSIFFENLYPGLWEEIYMNFKFYPIQKVCELCAGMTGAAGVAVSMRKYSTIFQISDVLITDGNDRCVSSIMSTVDHHKGRLSNIDESSIPQINIDVKNIRWPKDCCESPPVAELTESLIHQFHLIIAADCFFNQAYHKSMLNTIHKLLSLRSGSIFLAIAPLRGDSLMNFVNLAYQSETDYNWSVKMKSPSEYLHLQFISCIINESNRVQLTDNELDKRIGHLVILTRN
uniref:Calmodulin-lysine N-methyltransferase n=1 Tax=Trichobilharzia regenti TaxID=157069 RepID=A0AA85J9I5_TRIRE|nr:unnamed protein product [Trichobilharzia regenti]